MIRTREGRREGGLSRFSVSGEGRRYRDEIKGASA